jgi:hypothetical protein
MYSKDVLGDSISDDIEFDDLEDFDYVDKFIDEGDEDYGADIYDDEFDDLEDLYDDDGEDEEDEDDMDALDELDHSFVDEDNEIEVHLVCDDCAHKWIDYVSEEAYESDFDVYCPMCGSADITKLS